MNTTSLILAGEGAFLTVTKIGLLLFLAIYLIFAATIVKQVRIMVDTLNTGFETQIKAIVFIHFVFALLVFVMAIFIL